MFSVNKRTFLSSLFQFLLREQEELHLSSITENQTCMYNKFQLTSDEFFLKILNVLFKVAKHINSLSLMFVSNTDIFLISLNLTKINTPHAR